MPAQPAPHPLVVAPRTQHLRAARSPHHAGRLVCCATRVHAHGWMHAATRCMITRRCVVPRRCGTGEHLLRAGGAQCTDGPTKHTAACRCNPSYAACFPLFHWRLPYLIFGTGGLRGGDWCASAAAHPGPWRAYPQSTGGKNSLGWGLYVRCCWDGARPLAFKPKESQHVRSSQRTH